MATLYTIKGTSLKPLPRKAAIVRYQDYLLAGKELKAVKGQAVASNVALGVCLPCFQHLHSGCTKQACSCNCRMFNG